jgi:S-adenosylmethionine/arginine decarboxylase-like enzyme
MQSWGLHLLIDGFTRSKSLVQDQELIKSFVERLVADIDMVAYGPVWIAHFATHDPDKAGVSFCQMIETSNITGHFVDKDGSFYLDVFSCKDFSIRKVIDLIEEYFGAEEKDLIVRVMQRQSFKH